MTATGSPTDNVYTRMGVKPFINANIPFSYLGGTLEWPEVRRAMDEASRYTVDISDLQRAVGKRLAEVSGAESGMVTSGAAGSIAAATAACIAGTDPEKIWQLPSTTGLKHEVVMMGGRSIFDSAVRLAGGTPVVLKSVEGLADALNESTAMFLGGYPADPEPTDPPPLPEIVSVCRAAGVPVFVDAAGGIPPIENIGRYAEKGVDLYGFSGGKGLRGPSCSGLLLGRGDLIEAALANSSPVEGAVCRAMKVGREEIVGCLAAVEKWLTIDLEELYRNQTEMLERTADELASVPGVEMEIEVRKGSNRFMQLVVRWDEEPFGLSVEECGRRLREGEPPISVLANYNPYVARVREFFPPRPDGERKRRGDPLTVYSLGLGPGEELIVGRRLREALTEARARR